MSHKFVYTYLWYLILSYFICIYVRICMIMYVYTVYTYIYIHMYMTPHFVCLLQAMNDEPIQD